MSGRSNRRRYSPRCDFQPARDAVILRSIKTLETINGKPAAELWKEVDQN
jgi:hypothetical protein